MFFFIVLALGLSHLIALFYKLYSDNYPRPGEECNIFGYNMFVCISVRLTVCLSVCLSAVCLSVRAGN